MSQPWAEDARTRFDNLYERRPSWEVGRPQPAFVSLAERGQVGALVLDAGCGSGENALHLAALGHAVWGIDLSAVAIGMARAKARECGQPAARFLVHDALELAALGIRFDTVIDSGLFHAMVDAEQRAYLGSVAEVLRPGGRLHILCYSEHQEGTDGPRRVRAAELHAALSGDWVLETIEETRLVTNIHRDGARAYLASAELRRTRLAEGSEEKEPRSPEGQSRLRV